jgi:class 3 adenylate cyclase
LSFVSLFFTPLPLFAFTFFRRQYAVWAAVALLLMCAATLAALDNPPYPVVEWLTVAAVAVGCSVVVGDFATSIDVARDELADLNARLRRFLAPQVVEVINEEDALAPHRRDIAVCFVDLRGFTAFTNAVTAERVMSVLDEYYTAVGTILDSYDATIGGFDGDGVFAYIGDPKPHDDAAGEAVAMAREIAARLDDLTTSWGDLGYGIGVAYGEATLGLVGFANRADYTPVGAPVNLAARLCADAKHGEIVIDDALRKAAELSDVTRREEIDLKGFGLTETFTVAH